MERTLVKVGLSCITDEMQRTVTAFAMVNCIGLVEVYAEIIREDIIPGMLEIVREDIIPGMLEIVRDAIEKQKEKL